MRVSLFRRVQVIGNHFLIKHDKLESLIGLQKYYRNQKSYYWKYKTLVVFEKQMFEFNMFANLQNNTAECGVPMWQKHFDLSH